MHRSRGTIIILSNAVYSFSSKTYIIIIIVIIIIIFIIIIIITIIIIIIIIIIIKEVNGRKIITLQCTLSIELKR